MLGRLKAGWSPVKSCIEVKPTTGFPIREGLVLKTDFIATGPVPRSPIRPRVDLGRAAIILFRSHGAVVFATRGDPPLSPLPCDCAIQRRRMKSIGTTSIPSTSGGPKIVDRRAGVPPAFLAKQPGGHRQLLDLNPRPRGPNRSGCAACADIAPAVGTLDTRGQASDDRRTDEPDQSSARYPLPYAAPLRSLLLARSGLGTGSR